MNHFIDIFLFYLKKQLRSFGFWILTVILIVFISVTQIVVKNVYCDNSLENIVVVNKTNTILNEELAQLLEASYKVVFPEKDFSKNDKDFFGEYAETEATKIVLIEEDMGYKITCFGEINTYEDAPNLLNGYLSQKAMMLGINSMDLTSEQIDKVYALQNKVEIVYYSESEDSLGYFGVLVFVMIMIIFIIMYSNSATNAITYLKSNKIMEILITSVKPLPLYLGVNIAYCIGPIIQLGITVVASLLVMKLIDFDINQLVEISGLLFSIISIDKIVVFIIFLLLGYLLYALFSTSIVAAINKAEGSMAVSVPVAYLVLTQYFVAMNAVNSESIFVEICSYVPFTAPTIMFVRYACGNAGVLQVAISMLLLVAFIIIIAKIGAITFARGVKIFSKIEKEK